MEETDLAEKLMSELSGILNWAVQGCLDWQEHGLQTPLIVEDQGKCLTSAPTGKI